MQFNCFINTLGYKRKRGPNQSFTISREELLKYYVRGIFGAYKAEITTSTWDKCYRGAIIRNSIVQIDHALFYAEDMYLNIFVFLDANVRNVVCDTGAYYIWNNGIGTTSSKDISFRFWNEYKIIKPTIMELSQKAHVGYEPIMRTHRETLNFLNGLIYQSILSGATREETIIELKQYISYEFVQEAAAFFAEKQLDGSEWDDHIKARADLSDPEKYYNRVYDSIGNVKWERIKFKTKRVTKSALRWLDRL